MGGRASRWSSWSQRRVPRAAAAPSHRLTSFALAAGLLVVTCGDLPDAVGTASTPPVVAGVSAEEQPAVPTDDAQRSTDAATAPAPTAGQTLQPDPGAEEAVEPAAADERRSEAAAAPPQPAPEPARGPLPIARAVTESGWAPFALVGGVVLTLPSAYVELVGFHESNDDGARQLEPLASGVPARTLETRERGTGSRTAADVVVDPMVEILAPVTGTVLRAGSYILYCDHRDDYAVIDPDGHPGWEVKVIHIDGVRVEEGDRVEAGVTVLADGPTLLPFRSQVDDDTGEPSWPHVHIEVVDPSIPDQPSSGGGC